MKLSIPSSLKSAYDWFESAKTSVRDWFVHYAETPHALRWLAFFSFIESSFFPIPPDPLMAAMALAHRHRWVRFAAITSLFSVLGGMFGYFIGVFFFDIVGAAIIAFYNLEEEAAQVAELFNDNAFLTMLVAAFTPIPYKVFTISAGFFSVDLFVFIVASVLGRSSRFFIVSFLTQKYGVRFGTAVHGYFDLVTVLLLLIAGFIFFLAL